MTVAARITGACTPIVERAKHLLLNPKAEWPKIEAKSSTVGTIFMGYVAILAAVPALCELIGTLIFGIPILGVTYRPPLLTTLRTALWHYVLYIGAVPALALLLEALAPVFGGQANRLGAIKLAAYSATAAWVAGIFQLLPWFSALALLGLYSLYLLYTGLPVLLKVPAEKTLLFILSLLLIAAVLAIAFGTIQRSTADCASLHEMERSPSVVLAANSPSRRWSLS